MTEQINSILYKVQQHMRVKKEQKNNFGGYNYRTVDDILSKFKEIQEEYKVSITLNDEVILIGDRFYINATATLIYGEQTFTVKSQAREEESKKGMDASQVTGAASTYARKRALEGLLALDSQSESDPDKTNTHGKKPQPSSQPEQKQAKTTSRRESAKYTFQQLKDKYENCKTYNEMKLIYSEDLKGSFTNGTITQGEYDMLASNIQEKGEKLPDNPNNKS